MESFFGFILSDSMIFNSFFNYTFICKKLVSELRRFGTTDNSEDTASKLVVSILDMESFFGFILSDSMIFNSFFNYTFICKKLVSELRRFGTTEHNNRFMVRNNLTLD